MGSTLVTTGRKSSAVLLLALVSLIGLLGCKQPVVAKASEPASAGGIQFELGPLEARYLELTEGDETFEYPRPVLVVPVTMTNVGEDNLVYSPTHSAQQMSESATPLLYRDPGPEAALPPESKEMVNGVFLEKGKLEGQVTEATTIAAGSSVKDLFLFEIPPADFTSLVFSIPPAMHRDSVPVLFRIPYQPMEPKGPKVYDVGQTLTFGDAKFKVNRHSVEYVKTKEPSGEGYSSQPLLKIAYEITNSGAEPIEYEPGHRNVGGRSAALYGKSETFKRARFPASTAIEGQQTTDVRVGGGETVNDFVLFEMPTEDQTVVLEFPASMFEASGVARVSFDVTAEKPEKPKELQEKKEDG